MEVLNTEVGARNYWRFHTPERETKKEREKNESPEPERKKGNFKLLESL